MPQTLLLPLLASVLVAPSPRQSLQAATEQGHRSVFSASVTYVDGTTRKETIASMSTGGTAFVLMGTDAQGGEHQVWLDTIADIDVVRPEQIKVTFKDGKSLGLTRESYYALNVASPNADATEVRFEHVKHVHFLRPVRRDGLGNAIFDQWPFSPYTGKRVP